MPSKTQTPAEKADSLIALLNDRGTGDYIGEHISQLEHSLQCAHSAQQSGGDNELVLAALLHDIGQFLPLDEAKDVQMSISGAGSVGRVGHEMIGKEYLKSLGFGEKVYELVGSHVAAKRYLTAIDFGYHDGLSEASKQSLKFQGGPFVGEELDRFKSNPLSEEMVRLRKWDDGAKIVGIEKSIPRVEVYRNMMINHLEETAR